jgi:hypothetical protein
MTPLKDGELVDRPSEAFRASVTKSLQGRALAADFAMAACIQAAPLVIQRLVKIALGRVKKATVGNEIDAGRIVLGVAGVSTEVAPGGAGAGNRPLQEMGLEELAAVAERLAENLSKAHAIVGQSSQVPDSTEHELSTIDSSYEPAPSDPLPDTGEAP